MFTIPLLTILVAQGLLGSAYVVLEEENGYYRTWRSNPLESQPNPWSSFMNPQYYFPFLQNMNPFSWWQPQQSLMQDNSAMNIMYDRQKILFNILKCLIEEESKEMCRKLLGNAMPLFPEVVQVTKILISKPPSPKPTMMEPKPLDSEPTVLVSKPLEVALPVAEIKPIEIEMATMEVKPSMVESALSKSLEDEVPITPQVEPMKIEPEKIEPATMEVKPLETEPVELLSKPLEVGIPEPEMQRIETTPADLEIKPVDVNLKSEEVESAVL